MPSFLFLRISVRFVKFSKLSSAERFIFSLTDPEVDSMELLMESIADKISSASLALLIPLERSYLMESTFIDSILVISARISSSGISKTSANSFSCCPLSILFSVFCMIRIILDTNLAMSPCFASLASSSKKNLNELTVPSL